MHDKYMTSEHPAIYNKYLRNVNDHQLTVVVQHPVAFGGPKMYRNLWDPKQSSPRVLKPYRIS